MYNKYDFFKLNKITVTVKLKDFDLIIIDKLGKAQTYKVKPHDSKYAIITTYDMLEKFECLHSIADSITVWQAFQYGLTDPRQFIKSMAKLYDLKASVRLGYKNICKGVE